MFVPLHVSKFHPEKEAATSLWKWVLYFYFAISDTYAADIKCIPKNVHIRKPVSN